jgi:hypothetical protein
VDALALAHTDTKGLETRTTEQQQGRVYQATSSVLQRMYVVDQYRMGGGLLIYTK